MPESNVGPFATGTVVSWREATQILNEGEIVLVGQTHDLWVFFKRRDGTTFEAQEPSIDAIDDEIRNCAACGDIPLVTE